MDAGAWNKVERWIPGGPEEKVAPSGCLEPPVELVPGERPLDRRDLRGQGGNVELFFGVLFVPLGKQEVEAMWKLLFYANSQTFTFSLQGSKIG